MSGVESAVGWRALIDKRFEVRCERDIVFGRGGVGFTHADGPTPRELLLDAYLPEANDDSSRPALVMAFGGAFHRGSRADDRVSENGAANTPVSGWCREFARRGYACFSIDYRLVIEDPDPGCTAVVGDPDSVPRSRVDLVREKLGLPRASNDMLWRGIEAASDDFATAWRFVAANAHRWNVDPRRIAVGGFSAGARSAWNAAFGEGIDAAAIVALSGTMDPDDLERFIGLPAGRPPMLLVRGEHDLDYVQEQNPQAFATLARSGIDVAEVIVPGVGHFYPATAPLVAGSAGATSLESAVADFLAARLG